MALAGGLIFDLAGSEESQQNGPSGAGLNICLHSHVSQPLPHFGNSSTAESGPGTGSVASR